MNHRAYFLLAFLCYLNPIGDRRSCAAEPPTTITLFDGKSLDGWEGDLNYWRVENGAMVGVIPKGQTLKKNTWLVWRGGELRDFDLRLQMKLTGATAANSGIQFRCQVKDVDHVSGYQADLDQGGTWLGRIYDEHGRALLVERGTRVSIDPSGSRQTETFAPAKQYAVLFRENAWNDYRIVAIGDHIAVYVNGTLFSELQDQQLGEQDLQGSLALQLHSGPETRIEFRDIRLETLARDDARLGHFELKCPVVPPNEVPLGMAPTDAGGADLNFGFESGDLAGWKATGDAFNGQPIKRDGISSRWPGQTSNKHGEFFIGGYEVLNDRGKGTLTSPTVTAKSPYASFLFGGGDTMATRSEIFLLATNEQPEQVIFTAVGTRKEQMRRVVADLRPWQGKQIAVRLIDESDGGWGHLNFDDFRFHDQPPQFDEATPSAWRSTRNPVLAHLVPNSVPETSVQPGTETLRQMHVPKGFSVDLVAAESDLHQPMAFTFDARGRLWVVEGHSYPQKRQPGEGLDQILIFADENGDGSFESRKVFTNGLNLVSGLEVGHGGVWVGAAPELLFIPDADGDDLPDGDPRVLLDGFGFADTHETLNNFLWGPDGWLYGNQGVFNHSRIGKPGSPDADRQSLAAGVWRYHPQRHAFEVFSHGGSNPWGLDYDDFGQLFMTHCRSHWGGGPTTHVAQGGHYWNQVNGGHAPFISAQPLPSMPHLRNFMLASARYDHGEGGAGKAGSGEVYGGHSHVGTMIYLGDNWPVEYRNHLFTHNLHGHQINHQVNLREGGGFNTIHAGYDMLFCADRQFIGVDLMSGPDGAVYLSDWYDPRHCHNPDIDHWDRGNGRIYRMKFDANYRPVRVNLAQATDQELVDAQLHANEWHVRMARLVLSERAANRLISPASVRRLRSLVTDHADPARRLRALWSLHAISAIDLELVSKLINDDSEYVRAWTVQLAVESLPAEKIASMLEGLAEGEPSLFVRRYLASAIQRLPREKGWRIAETLAKQREGADDRELPLLLWYGIAGLMDHDVARALKIAETTPFIALRDYIDWFAAKSSATGRDQLSMRLSEVNGTEQLRLLSLFEFAVRGMRGIHPPKGWDRIANSFYESSDPQLCRTAESLGAAFGDESLFKRMRYQLAGAAADLPTRAHAVSVLSNDSSPENLPHLLRLLDTPQLRRQVLPLLVRYQDQTIAKELLVRLGSWEPVESDAAMEVLTSRTDWATALLDSIDKRDLAPTRLSAYLVRQLLALGDDSIKTRLAKDWGTFGKSSEERKVEIATLVKSYQSAPLWAYSLEAGAAHFKTLCSSCHQETKESESLAPKLEGSGKKGIEYIVENIMDPNAVIGRDFQARVVVTNTGQVVTGLVISDTDTSLTLRTHSNNVTMAKTEIEETRVSENSFMPEGLLKSLNDRERIELLKFLMSR